MHSCSYIANARLPATCFGLPYPIKFAACKNTFFREGEASTFLVSHDFSRGGGLEGPGTGSLDDGCPAGGSAEEASRAVRRSTMLVLLAPLARAGRGNMPERVRELALRSGDTTLRVPTPRPPRPWNAETWSRQK